MLENLPKKLPGISQKFHLLCFSVFPKILSIVMENLKYWLLFHYKVTESIYLGSYVQCIWVVIWSLNILLTALLEIIYLF